MVRGKRHKIDFQMVKCLDSRDTLKTLRKPGKGPTTTITMPASVARTISTAAAMTSTTIATATVIVIATATAIITRATTTIYRQQQQDGGNPGPAAPVSPKADAVVDSKREGADTSFGR